VAVVRRLARVELVRTGVLAPIPPFLAAWALWELQLVAPAGVLYAVSLVVAVAVAVVWARRGSGQGFVVVHLPAHPSWVEDPDGEEAARTLDALDALAHRLASTVVGSGAGHYDGDRITGAGMDLFFVGRDLRRVAADLRRALRTEGVDAPVTVA